MEGRPVVPPLIRRDAIRKARDDDAASLAALDGTGGHREWQARVRDGVVLIAEEDSEILGYIHAETINQDATLDLDVSDWERGIERQLLKRLISQLRRDGLRSAVISVDEYDVDLAALLGAYGFNPMPREGSEQGQSIRYRLDISDSGGAPLTRS